MTKLTQKMICQVYRSSRHEGMYLYVERHLDGKNELKKVPQALMTLFGEPVKAMMLMLEHKKELATVSADQVMRAIRDKGFYLQMPPKEESEMTELALLNSKLQLM